MLFSLIRAISLVSIAAASSGSVDLGSNINSSGGSAGSGGGGSSGTVTSVNATVPTEFSVSGVPITTAGTIAISKANESANSVWAGPLSGSAAAPTFRALVSADIPTPTNTTNGAVQAIPTVSSKWLNGLANSGIFSASQPAFSDLSGNISVNQMNSGTNADFQHLWAGNGAWITSSSLGAGTVTSVSASVPSIFSVSGVPITGSGTIAMTYSGTPLPYANGGTGATAWTSGSVVVAGTSAFAQDVSNFWDFTNHRHGIGTSSPASQLTINTSASNSYANGLRICNANGVGGNLCDSILVDDNSILHIENPNGSFSGLSMDRNEQTSLGGSPVAGQQLTVVATSATQIPIVAKGAGSQSSDLQEWQNSSSAVLAKVDSAGNITGTNSLVLNGSTSGALTNKVSASVSTYTLNWPSAQGSSGTALVNDGNGALSWSAPSPSGTLPYANGGTGATSWTSGSVVVAGTSAFAQDNANLFYDFVNHRLGIGTSSPSEKLSLAGNLTMTGGITGTSGNLTINSTNSVLLGTNANTVFIGIGNGQVGVGPGLTAANRLSIDGNLSVGTAFAGITAPTNGAIISGSVGIGTSSPTAMLHTTGSLRHSNFGAGAATFDASGNISSVSDERLKEIAGSFTRSIADLDGIAPIEFNYKKESGLDVHNKYYGFSAQNVLANIPEAVAKNKDGFLSIQDRALMAVMVNALNDLQKEYKVLKDYLCEQKPDAPMCAVPHPVKEINNHKPAEYVPDPEPIQDAQDVED